jgi:hypothetical protein
VVLSNLRQARSTLLLPGAAERYLIKGRSGLVADLLGGPKPIRLAVPPGNYLVERQAGGRRQHAWAEVGIGGGVPTLRFEDVPADDTRAKGGPELLELFAGARVTSGVLDGYGVGPGALAGVRRQLGPVVVGASLEGAWKWVSTQDPTYRLSSYGLALAGTYPLLERTVRLEAGLQARYTLHYQQVTGAQSVWSSDLGAGALVLASVRVGPVRVGVHGTLSGHRLLVNEEEAFRLQAGAALLLLWGL